MPPRLSNLAAGIPSFAGSSSLAAEAGRTISGGLETITDTLQGIGESRQAQVEGDIRTREDATRGAFDLALANALSLEDKSAVADQIQASGLSDADKAVRLNILFPAIQEQGAATFASQNAGRIRDAQGQLDSVIAQNPADPIFTLNDRETAGSVFRDFSRNNNLTGESFLGFGDDNADLQTNLNNTLRSVGISPLSQEAAVITKVALNTTPLTGEGDERSFNEDLFRTELLAARRAYAAEQAGARRVSEATRNFNTFNDNLRAEQAQFVQQFL